MSGNQSQFSESGLAFVGSALPAATLAKQVELGQISKIFVSHAQFLDTYDLLKNRSLFKLDIENLYNGHMIVRIFNIMRVLLCAKIKNKVIYIYHECCWQWLDICIWIIHPHGIFMPQVGMKFMFKPVDSVIFFFRHTSFDRALIHCFLSFFFEYRYYQETDKERINFAPTIRRYPASIATVESSGISPRAKPPLLLEKKMLILSGSDFSLPLEMIDLYARIVHVAISRGYKVLVKDHPNPVSRLNFSHYGVETIKPSIPAEFLYDDFSVVVGTASAAMAVFGSRSVSICKLLNSMSPEIKELRINYIFSINPKVLIAEEFDDIFLN